MPGPWWKRAGGERPAVSADFEHALMREVMRTELMRIKALIATVALLAEWSGPLPVRSRSQSAFLARPSPAHASPADPGPVHPVRTVGSRRISRYLRLDRDVPVLRRYLGALIETTMPTIALALHMDSMGRAQALGFVVPFTYFIFIMLSTLRLDFWLSAFTGLVAAAELFAMAMFYRPAGDSDPAPDFCYHAARSLVVLICGILAGAVGPQLRRQFAASIQAATARDRVTNLFGQHVSPQVVERLMAEGAAGEQRNPPGRGDVRRLPQFHRGRQHPLAARGGGSAGRRVRGAGRHPRPPWRHREQVPRRRIPGAVRRAAGGARRRAARGRRRARNAGGERTAPTWRRAGRCASASASISAMWSPAISARPGARNIP